MVVRGLKCYSFGSGSLELGTGISSTTQRREKLTINILKLFYIYIGLSDGESSYPYSLVTMSQY